jgi:hypothetical protein
MPVDRPISSSFPGLGVPDHNLGNALAHIIDYRRIQNQRCRFVFGFRKRHDDIRSNSPQSSLWTAIVASNARHYHVASMHEHRTVHGRLAHPK